MDAHTLNKWTRFADKGGIGRAVAVKDHMATEKGDLMFMKGDQIVLLKVLVEGEMYLGSCESIIGRLPHTHIHLLQKQLKKPVFIPHQTSNTSGLNGGGSSRNVSGSGSELGLGLGLGRSGSGSGSKSGSVGISGNERSEDFEDGRERGPLSPSEASTSSHQSHQSHYSQYTAHSPTTTSTQSHSHSAYQSFSDPSSIPLASATSPTTSPTFPIPTTTLSPTSHTRPIPLIPLIPTAPLNVRKTPSSVSLRGEASASTAAGREREREDVPPSPGVHPGFGSTGARLQAGNEGEMMQAQMELAAQHEGSGRGSARTVSRFTSPGPSHNTTTTTTTTTATTTTTSTSSSPSTTFKAPAPLILQPPPRPSRRMRPPQSQSQSQSTSQAQSTVTSAATSRATSPVRERERPREQVMGTARSLVLPDEEEGGEEDEPTPRFGYGFGSGSGVGAAKAGNKFGTFGRSAFGTGSRASTGGEDAGMSMPPIFSSGSVGEEEDEEAERDHHAVQAGELEKRLSDEQLRRAKVQKDEEGEDCREGDAEGGGSDSGSDDGVWGERILDSSEQDETVREEEEASETGEHEVAGGNHRLERSEETVTCDNEEPEPEPVTQRISEDNSRHSQESSHPALRARLAKHRSEVSMSSPMPSDAISPAESDFSQQILSSMPEPEHGSGTPTIHLTPLDGVQRRSIPETVSSRSSGGPCHMDRLDAGEEVLRSTGSPTTSTVSSFSRKSGAELDYDFKSHASVRASNPFALDYNGGLGRWGANSPGPSPVPSAGSSMPGTPSFGPVAGAGPAEDGNFFGKSLPAPIPKPPPPPPPSAMDLRAAANKANKKLELGEQKKDLKKQESLGVKRLPFVGVDSDDEEEEGRKEWENRFSFIRPKKDSGPIRAIVPMPVRQDSASSTQTNSSTASKPESTGPRMTRSRTEGNVPTSGLASQLRANMKDGPSPQIVSRARNGWETPSPTEEEIPKVPSPPAQGPPRRPERPEHLRGDMLATPKTNLVVRPQAQQPDRGSRRFSASEAQQPSERQPPPKPLEQPQKPQRPERPERGSLETVNINDAYDLGITPVSATFPAEAVRPVARSPPAAGPAMQERIVTPPRDVRIDRRPQEGHPQEDDRLRLAILARQTPMAKEGSSASCTSASTEVEQMIVTPAHIPSDRGYMQAGQAVTPNGSLGGRPRAYTNASPISPLNDFGGPRSNQSPASQWTSGSMQGSPKGSSASVTAMARSHRNMTVIGKTEIDLSSAKNPVPIRFLLGDQSGAIGVGLGIDGMSSEGHGSASESHHHGSTVDKHISPPLPAAFFPKEELRPPRMHFNRTEVPLPLHQSNSSQSLRDAYQMPTSRSPPTSPIYGDQEASPSVMEQFKTSLHKRSMSFKRGGAKSPEDAENTDFTPPIPPVPAGPSTPIQSTRAKSPPSLRVNTALSAGPPMLPPIAAGASSPISLPSPSVPSPIGYNKISTTPSALNRHPGENGLANRPSVGSFGARSKISNIASQGSASPVSSRDMFRTEKHGHAQFTMSDGPDQGAQPMYEGEEIDEWGFVGNSPVPPIFGLKKKDAQSVGKLEQTLLTIISKPISPGGLKKIKKVAWDHPLPSSLRCKAWAWLQGSDAPRRYTYRQIAEEFNVQRRPDTMMPFYRQFKGHRAFGAGTYPVQEMMEVYAGSRPKFSRSVDTSWIAAVFYMQAFDVEEAYWLYEGMLDSLTSELKPFTLKMSGDILGRLLAERDSQLYQALAKKGFRSYEGVAQVWFSSLFAASLPFPTVLRILDLLSLETPIFLYRIALAIFSLSSRRLQALSSSREILEYLFSPPADELVSPDSLIKAVGKITIPEKQFDSVKSRALSSHANSRNNS